MTQRRKPVGVLWCSNQRTRTGNGWSFPRNVEKKLIEIANGGTVLHPFGGRSRFGVRMDIDPTVKPDVIADAWLIPFGRNAFDYVVLDPPYRAINMQMKRELFRSAAFIARRRVIWFHTMWMSAGFGLRLERSWLVRVGDTCAVRCLQVFRTTKDAKRHRPPRFTRGPAMKYNRWLDGAMALPFTRDEPRGDQ